MMHQHSHQGGPIHINSTSTPSVSGRPPSGRTPATAVAVVTAAAAGVPNAIVGTAVLAPSSVSRTVGSSVSSPRVAFDASAFVPPPIPPRHMQPPRTVTLAAAAPASFSPPVAQAGGSLAAVSPIPIHTSPGASGLPVASLQQPMFVFTQQRRVGPASGTGVAASGSAVPAVPASAVAPSFSAQGPVATAVPVVLGPAPLGSTGRSNAPGGASAAATSATGAAAGGTAGLAAGGTAPPNAPRRTVASAMGSSPRPSPFPLVLGSLATGSRSTGIGGSSTSAMPSVATVGPSSPRVVAPLLSARGVSTSGNGTTVVGSAQTPSGGGGGASVPPQGPPMHPVALFRPARAVSAGRAASGVGGSVSGGGAAAAYGLTGNLLPGPG